MSQDSYDKATKGAACVSSLRVEYHPEGDGVYILYDHEGRLGAALHISTVQDILLMESREPGSFRAAMQAPQVADNKFDESTPIDGAAGKERYHQQFTKYRYITKLPPRSRQLSRPLKVKLNLDELLGPSGGGALDLDSLLEDGNEVT